MQLLRNMLALLRFASCAPVHGAGHTPPLLPSPQQVVFCLLIISPDTAHLLTLLQDHHIMPFSTQLTCSYKACRASANDGLIRP